jgi:hypothetical protein
MKSVKPKKELSPKEREGLLETLKARFEKNVSRHDGLQWDKVKVKLEADPEKLWSLNEMERTDGEPDVVGLDKKTGEYIFFDCSPESPKSRRSLCYDREALDSRKENKTEKQRRRYGNRDGHRAPDGRSIPGAAETWKLRYEDFELGKSACGYERTRRCALWRPPLRSCLHVSQRRGVLLRRQRIPRLAEGLDRGPG